MAAEQEVDLNPEGFIPLRQGLRDHIKRGKLVPFDLGLYVYLHLECNWGTGIYRGTAQGIAYGFDDASLKTQIQASLRRLRKKRYINYPEGKGKRGGYDILIHKFRPRTGKLVGTELNAWSDSDKPVAKYERVNGEQSVGSRSASGGGNGRQRVERPYQEYQEEQELKEVDKNVTATTPASPEQITESEKTPVQRDSVQLGNCRKILETFSQLCNTRLDLLLNNNSVCEKACSLLNSYSLDEITSVMQSVMTEGWWTDKITSFDFFYDKFEEKLVPAHAANARAKKAMAKKNSTVTSAPGAHGNRSGLVL